MNRILAVLCVLLAFASGCSGTSEQPPVGSQASEQEGIQMELDSQSVDLIQEASGCSFDRAKTIWNNLSTLGITRILSAEPMEGADDLSITITDDNDGRYELGIDKKGYLYSVKDMTNDKYVFTVYE